MKNLYLIGQIIGFFAMACSVASFQMKTHKRVMIVQLFTATLFTASYLLIGTVNKPAITAGALNAISVVRDVIYYNDDKKWASKKCWLYIFLIIYIVIGALTYQNAWSIVTTVAMLTNTLAFYAKTAADNRKVILTSAPLMLIYNIATLSIGGIINETLSMISTIIGVVRMDMRGQTFKDWFVSIFTTIRDLFAKK